MLKKSVIAFGSLTGVLATVLFTATPAAAQTQPAQQTPPGATNPAGPGAGNPGTEPADKKPEDKQADKPADKPGGLGVSDKPADEKKPEDKPGDEKKPDDKMAVDVNGSAGARAAGLPLVNPSGNFMDTRLTWAFGDDDFLHGTGELLPLSPKFSIGDRQQYRLFFDNLNSRFAGRENLTHLVMYKKMPGFIPNLTTEASVVLRFDLAALAANTGNVNQALYDSGSYLRAFYNTNSSREKEGISAVFFPLDTDRMRLGYLYEISWGGTDARVRQSIFPRIQGSSPGLKIQYDHQYGYAFLGFKTATIVQPQQVLRGGQETDVEVVRVGETNYGFLGGFGVDPHPNFRFDAGGGFFQQGKFDLEDVRGSNVYTYGGSARVVAHDNMPVPTSVDFLLYRNDPNAPMVLFRPEKYEPNKVAWSVSAEGSLIRQRLKDFETTGATKQETGIAGALQGVVKAGYLRASLTGIFRNLTFINRNVPGFVPFETTPKDATTSPELFAAGAIDYFFPSAHLTLGIGGGIQFPSTFQSVSRDASRTIVIRSQGNESILPLGETRKPIIQSRLQARWDLSEILAFVGWVQAVNDPNGTLVVRDGREGTASLRVPQSAFQLGAGLAVQARF
jgi:hypothetical protein